VCIFNDYPRFLDKVIRDHLTTHNSRREQVKSYCEDDCNDEPIKKVIHMHEVCKFDNDSLYLNDLFRDDLVAYTPCEEKVESCCEDVCIADEPLFLMNYLKMSAIIVVRRHVLRILSLESPLRKENLI